MLRYSSGDVIMSGDQVRYAGEPGSIEFIIDSNSSRQDAAWYLKEHGPGAMVAEPRAFGAVYVSQPENDEDLEFVARRKAGSRR